MFSICVDLELGCFRLVVQWCPRKSRTVAEDVKEQAKVLMEWSGCVFLRSGIPNRSVSVSPFVFFFGEHLSEEARYLCI